MHGICNASISKSRNSITLCKISGFPISVHFQGFLQDFKLYYNVHGYLDFTQISTVGIWD